MSRSDALVLFGATGDLARKKLFSSLYRLAARGRLDLPVIGVALSDWDNDQFRAHVREAIAATVADADADVVDRLCERLSLIGGDYADQATFAQLRLELERQHAHGPTFYLAIPPSFFPTVTEGLAGEGLHERSRIVVEKPFGRDLSSAVELNAVIHQHYAEPDIFRIDHYLGKESVEDLLVFRSPTPSSSRSGTGTMSTTCRSPCPSRSVWRVAAASMRASGLCATLSRTTYSRWSHCLPWSPRSVPMPMRCGRRR